MKFAKVSDELFQEMVRLHNEGLKPSKIASILSRNPGTIRTRLVNAGLIKPRKRIKK